MKIKILSFKLVNFKGIKNLKINDMPKVLNIRGQNGSGKTTLMDGFLWLFFGKDSSGRSDFNVKTLDENGNAIPKIDHEVYAVINTDGMETSFKRVLREKWVKKRGEEHPEFSGHETLYFVNEVPLSMAEYKAKVDAMIQEDLFKLLTNPLYFASLKWDKQREILFQMTNTVTDKQVADTSDKFTKVYNIISSKPLHEFKRELASKISHLKETAKELPSRIDEANRNMPEMPDVETAKTTIEHLEKKLSDIELSIKDKFAAYNQKNEANKEKMEEINSLHLKIRNIESEIEEMKFQKQKESASEKRVLQSKIDELQGRVISKNQLIQQLQDDIKNVDSELTSLRENWQSENEKQPPEVTDDMTSCPACNREFDPEKKQEIIEEFHSNWNKSKARKLEEINSRGVGVKERKTSMQNQLSALEFEVKEMKGQIDVAKEDQDKTPEKQVQFDDSKQREEISTLKAQIAELEKQMSIPEQPNDSELQKQKSDILSKIDVEKNKLGHVDTIDRIKVRIKELLESEKKYAVEIAELERMEFAVKNFEKAKVEMIEKDINEMFKYVHFNMFKQLINGGFEPTCEITCDGTPWHDLNAAKKLWSGIDIINTLSDYYDIYAPVWIDNRESVTEIPETKSQVINLYVDPEYKELYFENKKNVSDSEQGQLGF
ncbi:MAG: hypothetical protein K9H26_18435 [Prolixibacteraceae bacterium]|nr:hypothetical protein [Prolixibacteraceae bacterium]